MTKNQSSKKYRCKHCDHGFEKSVQLGGHVSKQHRGSSKLYIAKQAVREANATNREFLRQAKDWFKSTTGLPAREHRNKITQIKKALQQGRTPIVKGLGDI